LLLRLPPAPTPPPLPLKPIAIAAVAAAATSIVAAPVVTTSDAVAAPPSGNTAERKAPVIVTLMAWNDPGNTGRKRRLKRSRISERIGPNTRRKSTGEKRNLAKMGLDLSNFPSSLGGVRMMV
jgi:hypothetical protein